MKPEISHRCSSCGAAVREADALFCPECGQPLSDNAKNSRPAEVQGSDQPPSELKENAEATAEAEKTAAEAAEETAAVRPAIQPPPEIEPPAISPNTEPVVSTVAADEPQPKDSPGADSDLVSPTAARRGDKTRERLHRASEVARGVTRGVMEEPAKRVERIRQVSNVVIEEASYDPSLRFVLVALGLFVVFVILLVLSKVMG